MSETITKKDLRTVFWRSYQALGCYTYDKQQGISYMRALLPVLTKLYPCACSILPGDHLCDGGGICKCTGRKF